MAIVLLESLLLVSEKDVEKIMVERDKLVILLAEKCFSYRIIGLIVILLS
jgi:hypothetical protein